MGIILVGNFWIYILDNNQHPVLVWSEVRRTSLPSSQQHAGSGSGLSGRNRKLVCSLTTMSFASKCLKYLITKFDLDKLHEVKYVSY